MLTPKRIARFWDRVQRGSGSECWQWTGAKAGHSPMRQYGVFPDGTGRRRMAHRMAYELAGGSIPDGMVLDHLCRNTECVNPLHLEPVSSGENVLRGIGHSALNATKTHCIRGHELTPGNTYQRPGTTWRNCRKCKRAYPRYGIRARKPASSEGI